ncbi:MAG: hypothetical protein HYY92_03295 [Parcubacteria group bacterium]|nr:hypothetical protein [Parcubacteria group bacterium]
MRKEPKKSFEEKVIKKLDAIDKKFDAVDARFDSIDARFDSVDAKFDAVDARFDELAAMTARGFEETATKSELEEVRLELKGEIGEVKMRLDRMENILLRDHDNRIERLEDKLLQVEVILGKKLLH